MGECLTQYRAGNAHGRLAESRDARNDTQDVPEYARLAWLLGFDDGYTTNLVLRGTQAALECVQRERDDTQAVVLRIRSAVEREEMSLPEPKYRTEYAQRRAVSLEAIRSFIVKGPTK